MMFPKDCFVVCTQQRREKEPSRHLKKCEASQKCLPIDLLLVSMCSALGRVMPASHYEVMM